MRHNVPNGILMKNKIIWVTALIIFTLLIVRTFKTHVDGVTQERRWYIEQLRFDFSGVVDTARDAGNILFHVTHGNLDREKESRLNEQLEFNGVLALLLYRPNNKFVLMIDSAYKFRKGDSIYLSSDKNIVRIYRRKTLISEKELLKSIRGRPF
jgi:hypothetical protein